MRKQGLPTEERRERGVCGCMYRCVYRLKRIWLRCQKEDWGKSDVVLNGCANGVSVL